MLTAINSRAKLPTDLAAISRDHKITYRDILSTNPKTEKSKIQTYILHLAPASLSGFNVCPGAGNCKKVCLHFAGNPVYMQGKQSARIRRTLACVADSQRFARLIVCAILSKLAKNPEPIAIRLNGTSDIAWEHIDFTITPNFAQWCRVKFGAILPIGKRNIFEVFNFMRSNTGENVTFYDYTKIRRNWAECKRLGYHLTFSFDGWDNKANLKLCREAIEAGVNVAAAFNIKRHDVLPLYVSASHFDSAWHGRILSVYDGDLTDYRPDDGYNGAIIGLRFKLPHGMKWTQSERDSFCMM